MGSLKREGTLLIRPLPVDVVDDPRVWLPPHVKRLLKKHRPKGRLSESRKTAEALLRQTLVSDRMEAWNPANPPPLKVTPPPLKPRKQKFRKLKGARRRKWNVWASNKPPTK